MTQLPLPLLQHSSRDPRAHLNAAVTAVHTRPDLSDSIDTTACLFICGAGIDGCLAAVATLGGCSTMSGTTLHT